MKGHSLSYIVLYLCYFLPNTFYMVTDLIHLNQFQFNFYAGLNLGEWKYFTYLLLGVFLAVYVMILIYF